MLCEYCFEPIVDMRCVKCGKITIFEDCPDELSFKEFSFDKYIEHEETKLKPQLINMGYNNISFKTGERDSWGTLSRVITCIKDGITHNFVYG